MKEIYKERGEQSTSRRDRRMGGGKKGEKPPSRGQARKRRLAGVVLVVGALLAALAADYLLNDGEFLQAARIGGEAEEVEPGILTQEADNPGIAGGQEAAAAEPTVLLGEFFTDYAWDPDSGRQSNLRMASEAIDGTFLAPGEEFSAIDVLSPLDYEAAKVFANGGVDYEVGGGLCQVSSTLFMAANYAGLEITDRNPHYAELPYIQPGLDATVWFGEKGNGWGALDMRFRNNTDQNILVREFVNEDGFLVAQIYGERPTGRVVSMYSERIDEDINKGLTWATYKKVSDNGTVVEDGLLFETLYSYNPPTPEEIKHETNEPRGSGWVDASNTTNWNDKD